jgi:translation initiation factor eIF-2B subunit epsilon
VRARLSCVLAAPQAWCAWRAEVRTFADCARYVLTTLMDLQAPPSATVALRFHRLFAAAKPDVNTKAGKLALLNSFKSTLAVWVATLRKFLHDEEDQFELLLTLEEYCGERGVFSGTAQVGGMYVPIFSNVLMQLYEDEIIVEDVFLGWEQAKLHDDEDDQVRPCLGWFISIFYQPAAHCQVWIACSENHVRRIIPLL